MFKWPQTPSPRASKQELADYTELVCWREGLMSRTALSGQLGRIDDNDYSDGVPEEDPTDGVVHTVYAEIEQRLDACRDGYPFLIDNQGYTLRSVSDIENHRHIVYQYLLLATRLNMNESRMQADIDGALLLEELAADVAREYFGARAESIVFGTAANTQDFPNKVNQLCKGLKEGDGFLSHQEAPTTERDGKLDVVAWKHFNDGRPGKLIAFGQCKTGTSYMNTLSQLQPDSFCRKWFRSFPALVPLRMFFVADAISRLLWYNAVSDAGLLFDRCRIVDFCGDISADVLSKVKAWTAAAARENELEVRWRS